MFFVMRVIDFIADKSGRISFSREGLGVASAKILSVYAPRTDTELLGLSERQRCDTLHINLLRAAAFWQQHQGSRLAVRNGSTASASPFEQTEKPEWVAGTCAPLESCVFRVQDLFYRTVASVAMVPSCH